MTEAASMSTPSDVVPFPRARQRITFSEVEVAWRDPVFKRLEALIRLPAGWDGYAGLPVSIDNAWFAVRLLEACCPPDVPAPSIVPGATGDLQIEWHTERGDIELHIVAPNDVRAWWMRIDSPQPDGQERPLTNDFADVASWIKEIVERPLDLTSGTAAA